MKKVFLLLMAIFCAVSLLLSAEEPEAYEFKGRHFIASYLQCDSKALSDVDALRQAVFFAIAQSGATILESVDHLFPPDGFTMVVLLSESHASIHTYPEHGACFVDLFTCGNHCSAQRFDEALREYLKPAAISHKTLVRDQDIEDSQ